jgi:hypothetical protein
MGVFENTDEIFGTKKEKNFERFAEMYIMGSSNISNM